VRGCAVRITRAVAAVILFGGALAFAITVIAACVPLITGDGLLNHDTRSFWSTGQLLAHGKNPYDATEVLRLQRAAGITKAPLIMRNPPLALPLVLPLGYLSLHSAVLLWSALLLAAFVLSVHLLWATFGRPRGIPRWLPYAFAPALNCIVAGQTAVLPLLGVALFFRYRRLRPFAAGAALWLCILKPHLLVPFAIVLSLWSIRERQFRILAGAAAAVAASVAIVWALDPHAWAQYVQMMRGSRIEQEYIPCIGVALRFALRPSALWLQWLPCVIGSGFAVVYYWRNRATWSWDSDGGLLLLISLVAAPYAWVSDTALALPALMHAAIRRHNRVMLWVLATLVAILEAEFLAGVSWHSPLFLWPASAWLLWYLCNNALALLHARPLCPPPNRRSSHNERPRPHPAAAAGAEAQ
jgi:glycosyl transferase family 87